MPELSVKDGLASEAADILPTIRPKSGYKVLDLSAPTTYNDNTCKMRTLRGIGYDWVSLQLGEATGNAFDPTDAKAPRAEYRLGKVDADSVSLTVYALPFFPIYKGKGTKFGVSVDDAEVKVLENLPQEYSPNGKPTCSATAPASTSHSRSTPLLTTTP